MVQGERGPKYLVIPSGEVEKLKERYQQRRRKGWKV
jgi:hypothetical protein